MIVNTPSGRKPNVILFSCGPATADSAMMKRITGNAIVSSVMREMTMSIQPPKYPAAAPQTTPKLIEIAVARMATSSDARPP